MSVPVQHSTATAALAKADVSSRQPLKGTYPSACSVPVTSSERLALASPDNITAPRLSEADTVLYLAYGSNMCAKTFLGVRGIRPLSQVNVLAPSIRLIFDLPGLPYREPCFANVAYRVPESEHEHGKSVHQDMEWNGGLIGVVYEITQEDYRTIMRTEGAGSSYKEIVVSCYPIAPREACPKEGQISFLAKTLYGAYSIEETKRPSKKNWWQRLLHGRQRPDPNYAQPSLRYLNLLRIGAEEHNLPASYRDYLDSLHPYVVTRWTQTIGQYVFIVAWAPFFVFFFLVMPRSRLLDEDTGKLPSWLARGVAIMFKAMWMSYDMVFKPVFGDGERTEGDIAVQKRLAKSDSPR
ncbi:uncharacterized protein UV8b_03609 [Ustilaginoidea virens]|uniref:gamma-glutamylcyclotransferase n=1 Tax=Ustilaginoidea virens TaxID=1159556 RepID=A0A1B5KRZ3_USTVR|nr:uncharacterized protein UV8b_03609 [Ustilaginoidea virens]QUC19368.1 hypothetical protein UV8b_03609 [Ustilaginoidea virens]GAO13198.1 hypothetical protein UVI_02025480 [Ustilaginoidea virens]